MGAGAPTSVRTRDAPAQACEAASIQPRPSYRVTVLPRPEALCAGAMWRSPAAVRGLGSAAVGRAHLSGRLDCLRGAAPAWTRRAVSSRGTSAASHCLHLKSDPRT